MTTDLIIDTDATVLCVYSEVIPLDQLGRPKIERASHVEPTSEGGWTADLTPMNGPKLGPFQNRTEALHAEVAWLESHWLT